MTNNLLVLRQWFLLFCTRLMQLDYLSLVWNLNVAEIRMNNLSLGFKFDENNNLLCINLQNEVCDHFSNETPFMDWSLFDLANASQNTLMSRQSTFV